MNLLGKSPLSLLYLSFFLVLTGFYTYQLLARKEDLQLQRNLETTLASLRQELAAKQSLAGEIKARWKGGGSAADNSGEGEPHGTADSSTTGKDTVLGAQKTGIPYVQQPSEWFVRDQIAKVERYIAVTEEERAKLADLARTGVKGGLIKASALPELEKVLGRERATELIKRREEDYRAYRKEKINNKVYILSRRLALDPQQEEKVFLAIEESRAEASSRSISESFRYNQDGSHKSPAEIARHITQAERELLNPKLREILSEEQYTRLLDYQESQRNNFLF